MSAQTVSPDSGQINVAPGVKMPTDLSNSTATNIQLVKDALMRGQGKIVGGSRMKAFQSGEILTMSGPIKVSIKDTPHGTSRSAFVTVRLVGSELMAYDAKAKKLYECGSMAMTLT